MSEAHEVKAEQFSAGAAGRRRFWRRPEVIGVAVIFLLLGSLLVPAIREARDAARRCSLTCRGKQLGLSMHAYADLHKRFPAGAIYGDGRRPLLSWRVEILKHQGEEELVGRFQRDEPWDSESNKPLLAEMPNFYSSPFTSFAKKTSLVVPRGEHTMFAGNRGIAIAEIKDGTSRTILLLEIDDARAVPWTAPRELDFDPQNPIDGLGTSRGSFMAGIADGAVRFIPRDVDREVFRSLIDPADGGEVGLEIFGG